MKRLSGLARRWRLKGERFTRGENIEVGDPPCPPFVRGGGLVGRLAVDWRGFDSRAARVAVATAPAPLVRGRACGQACGDWRERGFVGVRPSCAPRYTAVC